MRFLQRLVLSGVDLADRKKVELRYIWLLWFFIGVKLFWDLNHFYNWYSDLDFFYGFSTSGMMLTLYLIVFQIFKNYKTHLLLFTILNSLWFIKELKGTAHLFDVKEYVAGALLFFFIVFKPRLTKLIRNARKRNR